MGICNSTGHKPSSGHNKALRKVTTLSKGEKYYGKRGDQSE